MHTSRPAVRADSASLTLQTSTRTVSLIDVIAIVLSTMLFVHSVAELPSFGKPSVYDHTVPIISAVFLFTFWRRLLYAYFMPLLLEYGPEEETKARKFCQQLLNFMFHTTSTIYLFHQLPQRAWFRSDEALWKDFPDQTQDYYDVLAYMLQLGYHTNCLMIHFSEPRREDHHVMFVHHAVTVFLLVSSFAGNYLRMGLLVLMYHDSSDVLGCLIKMTNYLGWKKTTLFIYPNMCTVWFIMRLYYFPRVIFVTALALYPRNKTQMTSVVCLSVLTCLHAYWFYLFLRMGYDALVGKGITDLSEEKKKQSRSSSPITACEGMKN